MKKLISVLVPGMILVLALTACSDLLQVDIPELIPEIVETESVPTVSTDSPANSNNNSPVFGLDALQMAYEQVYEEVLPSVVSISTVRSVSNTPSIFPGFPFEGEEDENLPEFQQQGAGSGFVWDTEGHIITNNHVVEGADIIRVRFSDGSIALGELIGADPASDLAVIFVDVDPNKLIPIAIADSTKVKIGQIAIAIGNPFQLDGSMTTGIVSGIGRSLTLDSDPTGAAFSIPDIIQTDAPINPGNSGGVLVDIDGNLIGVTTAIESPIRANAGIGYAVPSVIVEKIVPFLIQDGIYQQPWIGISGTTLTPELAEAMELETGTTGALIREVIPNSPADDAGLVGSSVEVEIYGNTMLVGGDVIAAIDDTSISDFEDIVAYLARYTNVGTQITLTVIRDNEFLDLELTLGARPGQETVVEGQPEDIQGKAWLGITGIEMSEEIADAMDLDKNTSGVLVQQVNANSPADEAGIRGSFKPFEFSGQSILIGGDIITKVESADILDMAALRTEISKYAPGDEISIEIIRDGDVIELLVTLEEGQPG